MRLGLRSALMICVLMLVLTGCFPKKETAQDPNKIQVYTTIYPLAYFTERIGGGQVQVTNLVPVGVESHDFEPSAKDLAQVAEGDLFIYNGSGFEPWSKDIDTVIDQQKTLKIDATSKLKLLKADQDGHTDRQGHHDESTHDEHGHEEESEAHKEEEAHDHGEFDPHVWLDPVLAKQQALMIKNGLVKADAKHKATYEQNYKQLATDLDKLDREFAEMVKHAKHKEFVVSHDAFSYLAKRYGLKQIAISGLSPSDEPSAKELENVIKLVKEHQLKAIFFETLVDPKVAKTVQSEAKVDSLVLNPLEGLTPADVKNKADYLSIMRVNQQNLAKALERK